MSVSVGIDIGTSNSCACFYRNGTCEPFTIPSGARILPSYVSYQKDGPVIVGEDAKRRISYEDFFTICSFKRIIGRKFNSEEVQAMLDRCIAPLCESASGEAEFYDEKNGKTYSAIDLTTVLIKGILAIVRKNSGLEIGNITFTIPAFFTAQQRSEMEIAIRNAGIAEENYCLITEPTAAAINYGIDNNITSRIFLVYDMGGGTFDVSVMRISLDRMSVINHDGDNFLGGESFDAALFDHVVQQLKNDYGNSPLPPEEDKKYLHMKKKLLTLCEDAKKSLVYEDTTVLDLDPFSKYLKAEDSVTFVLSLATMNLILEPFMKRAIGVVDRAILNAGLKKKDVHSVVLVGGSTRLKCVKSSLRNYFGDSVVLHENVNPDEAVAKGACLFCASWIQNKAQPTLTWFGRVITMDEVTTYSIGIGGPDDKYYCIIPKNSVMNGKKYRKRLRKSSDTCTEQYLYVYQGDHPIASKNRVLNRISWSGFPDYPAQYVYFDLFLSIERDGYIYADVIDVRTKDVYLDHFLILFIVSYKYITSQGNHYSSIKYPL